MAAAYRNKKRNRRALLRRKKKHMTRRKILQRRRRRRLLAKRRRQLLRRRKMVKKKGRKTVIRKVQPKRQSKRNPSDVFVIKVLRRLHRDKVHISTKAKGKIISFIRKFYNRISEKANNSSQCKKSCIIGSRELQNALKRVMRDKQATELVKSIRKVSRRR